MKLVQELSLDELSRRRTDFAVEVLQRAQGAGLDPLNTMTALIWALAQSFRLAEQKAEPPLTDAEFVNNMAIALESILAEIPAPGTTPKIWVPQ